MIARRANGHVLEPRPEGRGVQEVPRVEEAVSSTTPGHASPLAT